MTKKKAATPEMEVAVEFDRSPQGHERYMRALSLLARWIDEGDAARQGSMRAA